LVWRKRRVLDVYLNVAEFGNGVYGVGAASHQFFAQEPARLGREQAALLAAVLPSPKRLLVARPSAYVRSRQEWILSQMEQLGGIGYLDGLR
jgi:monofunctional biosynthetic peptidoglycan transglycosylase